MEYGKDANTVGFGLGDFRAREKGKDYKKNNITVGFGGGLGERWNNGKDRLGKDQR